MRRRKLMNMMKIMNKEQEVFKPTPDQEWHVIDGKDIKND